MTSDRHTDVVVIGAGAAGLMAATRAAERGRRVLLLEKNTKPGVKILMSGGTRCNLTHATDRRTLADAFCRPQARFLRSPLSALGPEELVDLFHAEGLETKVEPTGKIFPASDRALDVQRTLLRMLEASGAVLELRTAVQEVAPADAGYVVTTSTGHIHTQSLLMAVGGQSYPGCGTTGDGYAWAKSLGHSIVPPRPALVPLKTREHWSQQLTGLTMPDMAASVVDQAGATLASKRGSLLFTHFGVSGPLAMDLSREVTARARGAAALVCDLLPHRNEQQLLTDLQSLAGKQHVRSTIADWLPSRLADALLLEARVPPDRLAAEFSKAERGRLLQAIKRLRIELAGSLGFAKAEVTAGGVDLSEVDSRDMQSKCSPGLYLAGEILDIDGPIGGYNFQAAFSTGRLAGEHL